MLLRVVEGNPCFQVPRASGKLSKVEKVTPSDVACTRRAGSVYALGQAEQLLPQLVGRLSSPRTR